MKRIQLIAAALCLVMLATVGTGVVAAKPSPSNYKFDVTYNDEVVGQAVVNTANPKAPTYSIVIRGLSADTQYIFGYTVSGVAHELGLIPSVPNGAIVRQGTLSTDDVTDIQSAQFWVMKRPLTDGGGGPLYGFYLDNLGAFIAKIACYYSTDGGATWHESDHVGLDHRSGWASLKSLGVPDVALVKIHVIVVGGKDRTGDEWSYDYSKSEYNQWYAAYYITGKTWNPTLTYNHMTQILS